LDDGKFTSSTAQGDGGSFKDRNNYRRGEFFVMHGWQSEPTDGSQGGWSCAFGVVAVVT